MRLHACVHVMHNARMHNSFVPASQLMADLRVKLSQPEISERTGIPQSTLSRIESGVIVDPVGSKYHRLQVLHRELFGAGSEGSEGQPIPPAVEVELVKVAA